MGVARGLRTGFAAVAATVAWWAVPIGAPPVHAAGEFTVAPTDLSFPATAVGASSSLTVTVTNVSSSPLTPNFAGGAPSDGANFGGSQNCAGKTFDPGDTCTFTYEFHPQSPGPHSASTTIGVGSDDFSITLTGTGSTAFEVAPTDLVFPDTPVGGTSSIDVVIRNVSSASLTPSFSGGAPIDPTHFGGSQNCAGKTFAPGDTCAFTYTFQPVADGSWSTTTTIGIDDQNVSITMTGKAGTAPTTTTSATTTTTPSDTTADTDGPGSSNPVTDAGLLVVEPPLAAGSDAVVVAQGIIELGRDAVAWRDLAVGGDVWPFSFGGQTAAFFAITGRDAVLVTADDQSLALLDDGEATFLAAGVSVEAGPLDATTPSTVLEPASTLAGGAPAPVAHVISLAAATGTGTFAPGEGRRDVNLIRDVLAPGETFEVRSPFPILAVVVDGELVDTRNGDTPLVTHSATTLETRVVLRNDSDAPATVLAATVGGPVP